MFVKHMVMFSRDFFFFLIILHSSLNLLEFNEIRGCEAIEFHQLAS